MGTEPLRQTPAFGMASEPHDQVGFHHLPTDHDSKSFRDGEDDKSLFVFSVHRYGAVQTAWTMRMSGSCVRWTHRRAAICSVTGAHVPCILRSSVAPTESLASGLANPLGSSSALAQGVTVSLQPLTGWVDDGCLTLRHNL